MVFAIFLSFLSLSIARESHRSQFGLPILAKFSNSNTKTVICPLKALSMVKGGLAAFRQGWPNDLSGWYLLYFFFLSFLSLSIAREAHRSQFGPPILAKFFPFDAKTG